MYHITNEYHLTSYYENRLAPVIKAKVINADQSVRISFTTYTSTLFSLSSAIKIKALVNF